MKKKLITIYYRDESDKFCPGCDSRTNGTGGHNNGDGSGGYEIRQCSECKTKYKLIY